MVLDSSAIIAVLLQELGFDSLEREMGEAPYLSVGAPTLVETAVVLTFRMRRDGLTELNGFLRKMEIEVIPFSREHFEAAAAAYLRFGKGRHRAALNFGDCCAYAVAKLAKQPLLYKGRDFSETDLA